MVNLYTSCHCYFYFYLVFVNHRIIVIAREANPVTQISLPMFLIYFLVVTATFFYLVFVNHLISIVSKATPVS